MQTLDNLLLIICVAFLLWYCYKKKKFPFRRFPKNGKTADIAEKTERDTKCEGVENGIFSAQANPFSTPYNMPFIQGIPNNPYLFAQSLQNMQNACGTSADTSALTAVAQPQPLSVTLCKLIPWTTQYIPLPFGEDCPDHDHDSEALLIGATLNSEITALNSEGYTVLGISAVSIPLDTTTVRILFMLTCGRNSPSA